MENTNDTKLTFKDYADIVPEGQNPKFYLKLVKEQLLGNKLTEEDLKLFLYVCNRTGLDPLTNQIYAVPRWDSKLGREKMCIQTGIDGFRLVAQRSGQYAGQDDVIFEPEDESTTYPTRAKVTVYRMVEGEKVPVSATARWSEYAQTKKNGEPTMMWKKMPYTMLGKCAESLALRKAFPNELSGLYTDTEMAQAANPLAGLPAPKKSEKPAEPAEGEIVQESVSEMRKNLEKEDKE
jgi:phage recombination protein Bet